MQGQHDPGTPPGVLGGQRGPQSPPLPVSSGVDAPGFPPAGDEVVHPRPASADRVPLDEDSDHDPPVSGRDSPGYVAMWGDPGFRRQFYSRALTPEEEVHRQRLDVNTVGEKAFMR